MGAATYDEPDYPFAQVLLDQGATPNPEALGHLLLSGDKPDQVVEELIQEFFRIGMGNLNLDQFKFGGAPTGWLFGHTCLTAYVAWRLSFGGNEEYIRLQNDTLSSILKTASANTTDSDEGQTAIMCILLRHLYEITTLGLEGYQDFIRRKGREAWRASAIEILLSHNASLDHKDVHGQSAIDIAIALHKKRKDLPGATVTVDILRCLLTNVRPGCIAEEERARGMAAIDEILVNPDYQDIKMSYEQSL